MSLRVRSDDKDRQRTNGSSRRSATHWRCKEREDAQEHEPQLHLQVRDSPKESRTFGTLGMRYRFDLAVTRAKRAGIYIAASAFLYRQAQSDKRIMNTLL